MNAVAPEFTPNEHYGEQGVRPGDHVVVKDTYMGTVVELDPDGDPIVFCEDGMKRSFYMVDVRRKPTQGSRCTDSMVVSAPAEESYDTGEQNFRAWNQGQPSELSNQMSGHERRGNGYYGGHGGRNNQQHKKGNRRHMGATAWPQQLLCGDKGTLPSDDLVKIQ